MKFSLLIFFASLIQINNSLNELIFKNITCSATAKMAEFSVCEANAKGLFIQVTFLKRLDNWHVSLSSPDLTRKF